MFPIDRHEARQLLGEINFEGSRALSELERRVDVQDDVRDKLSASTVSGFSCMYTIGGERRTVRFDSRLCPHRIVAAFHAQPYASATDRDTRACS